MIKRLVPLLAVVALTAASCSHAGHSLVVGAVYPTGGPQGMEGDNEYRGVQLAADYVNERGGVKGRMLDLNLAPTDSAEAVPGAMRSLARSGAAAIVGSYGSTMSAVAATVATRERLVFWETGAVGELPATAARGRSFFRVAPTGASLGRAAVAFVRDHVVPKLAPNDDDARYAVAYVDDVYGRAVGNGAIAEIERSGREVRRFPYELTGTDYDALARRIERSGADVLVVAAYLEDGIALRRASVRAGLPLVTSIGTSSSYCHLAFGHTLGRDAVGLFASDKPDGPALRTDGLSPEAAAAFRWLKKEYRARYGLSVSAPTLAGFAGAWALFRYVLPRAEKLTPSGIAEAARRVSLPLGSLPNGSGLDFDGAGSRAGDNLRATSVIWQWVKPGTRAIVWPPAFATHDLLAIRPR